MWWELDYSFFLGEKRVSSVPLVQVGQILYLNPIAFMYVIKAEFLLTYSFAGGGVDSFVITLSEDTTTTSKRISAAATYELDVWDVSDWMEEVLKKAQFVSLKSYFNVTNALNPVDIMGMTLRFTFYKNDTFGGYNNPTDPLLILDTEVSKDYIEKQAKLSENFRYLSGLEME